MDVADWVQFMQTWRCCLLLKSLPSSGKKIYFIILVHKITQKSKNYHVHFQLMSQKIWIFYSVQWDAQSFKNIQNTFLGTFEDFKLLINNPNCLQYLNIIPPEGLILKICLCPYQHPKGYCLEIFASNLLPVPFRLLSIQ